MPAPLGPYVRRDHRHGEPDIPDTPLPTLVSYALVAPAIELDHEEQHRLPHRALHLEDPRNGRTVQRGSRDALRGMWQA